MLEKARGQHGSTNQHVVLLHGVSVGSSLELVILYEGGILYWY